MAIPGELQKMQLGGGLPVFERATRGEYGTGLTTMFWLPASDPDADRRVVEQLDVTPMVSGPDARALQRLTRFVSHDVSTYLPFLKSLALVTLFNRTDVVVRASLAGDRRAGDGDQISVDVESGTHRTRETFFQYSGSALIPPDVRNDPETPRAVREMRRPGVRLSVRVTNGAPAFDSDARFHVYFPTDEPTGFGLTVHGDFYVKPDRTRLMPGRYNDWLMDVAAKLFAGEFLTQALHRYESRSVFESLRPSAASHEVGSRFRSAVRERLRKRRDPFIPSTIGPLPTEEVALPPYADGDGFWKEHFGGVVQAVTTKKAFLTPSADSPDARQFFQFVGVQPIPPSVILNLIERAEGTDAKWWGRVYHYLATHDEFKRWGHSILVGRRLLLTAEGEVVEVPPDGGRVVCFSPTGDAAHPDVPHYFRPVFVFLKDDVLGSADGAQVTREWLNRACQVARFESSEVLPRAIRGSVHRMYAEPPSGGELLNIWRFIHGILSQGRGIESAEFWLDVGRLPVPIVGAGTAIAPAFLTYWPDDHPRSTPALRAIPRLRRVDAAFLNALSAEPPVESAIWMNLLERAGVGGSPKALSFVRFVGGGRDVPLASIPAEGELQFTGDHQRDENGAVLEALSRSMVWPNHVSRLVAGDSDPRWLQRLTTIEGLEECVDTANAASAIAGGEWTHRLWSLVREMPDPATFEADLSFRRLPGGGGVNHVCESFVGRQLRELRWLPTSLGPATLTECFLRLKERRFISRGTATEELGDRLVPYVVANDLNDYIRLRNLGVEALEEGASTTALVRFLTLVGHQFDDSAVREAWLDTRSRWRLLRGAIQEAYRAMNLGDEAVVFPEDIRLAAIVDGKVQFRTRPLFHAEPGSAPERAFRGELAFLDADRPYQRLFEWLGITRLVSGQTLDETIRGEANAVDAPSLRAALVKSLGLTCLRSLSRRRKNGGTPN